MSLKKKSNSGLPKDLHKISEIYELSVFLEKDKNSYM